MAAITEAAIKQKISIEELHSSLSALKSEQEADRLSRPFIGLTGPQERNLAVINAQVAGVTQDAELARRQRQLEQPFRQGFLQRLDAERGAQDALNKLLGLDVSGAGRAGREAQAQGVLSILNQFDPRVVATSAQPFFRQLRQAGVSAYQVEHDALQENVRDQIEREKTGNLIQSQAREQWDAIRASGVPDAEKVKAALTTLGQLSDKEFVPDLRLAKIELLRQSATLDAPREQQAREIANLQSAILKKLDALITAKGIKVDGPVGTVNVIAPNGWEVDRSQTGEAPTAQQVQPGDFPGSRY